MDSMRGIFRIVVGDKSGCIVERGKSYAKSFHVYIRYVRHALIILAYLVNGLHCVTLTE